MKRLFSINPKGIEPRSPGLRGTSYPGINSLTRSTLKGLRHRDTPLLVVLAAIILATARVLAGPADIIKRRAQELNNQNNVRQGVAPPTQPTQPPASTPAPPSQSLTRLQADLAAMPGGSAATAEQKQKLANGLVAAAQGAKPTPAAAAKLAEDLTAAFATKALSATSRARLAQELDAVLNPTKYPQAKMQAIFDDIQAIFQENGLDRKHAVAISDDVKALVPR